MVRRSGRVAFSRLGGKKWVCHTTGLLQPSGACAAAICERLGGSNVQVRPGSVPAGGSSDPVRKYNAKPAA